MSSFLYNLYILLIGLGIHLAAPFSNRARRWLKDRAKQNVNIPTDTKKAWFHVSSLGELEQAYPLIKSVKDQQYLTIVSFFSHSGYDYAHRYPSIDYSFLLPLDTSNNARRFSQAIKADVVFWTKNDFWLNTLNTIIKEGTPVILFAASFYDSHFILHPFSGIFRKTLSQFEKIFVQNKESSLRLSHAGIHNATVSGDTRIERVKERSKSVKTIDGLPSFCSSKPVLILASVHLEDNVIIKAAISQFIATHKLIVIPHDVGPQSINKIMRGIPKELYEINYSFASAKKNIIVFNKIGFLFDIYPYADVVYIGGGFGKGIHNILEPTIFGKSVIFGPRFKKFWEAQTFIDSGLAKCCRNPEDFIQIINSTNKESLQQMANDLKTFYRNYPNPVEQIMNYCNDKKLLN